MKGAGGGVGRLCGVVALLLCGWLIAACSATATTPVITPTVAATQTAQPTTANNANNAGENAADDTAAPTIAALPTATQPIANILPVTTAAPPTNTPLPPTDTPLPPTNTAAPPTDTPAPPIAPPGRTEIELTGLATASATSFLPPETFEGRYATYAPANVLDHDLATNWTAAGSNDGRGAAITLTFPRAVRVTHLRIGVGAQHDAAIFKKNARVKTATLTFNTGAYLMLHFDDQMGLQDVVLPKPPIATAFTLAITSVYPGSDYHDAPIAEIDVYGM